MIASKSTSEVESRIKLIPIKMNFKGFWFWYQQIREKTFSIPSW